MHFVLTFSLFTRSWSPPFAFFEVLTVPPVLSVLHHFVSIRNCLPAFTPPSPISCATARASSNKDHDSCVLSPPNPKHSPKMTSPLQLTGATHQSADARHVLSTSLSTKLARSYSPTDSSAGHGAFRHFAAQGTRKYETLHRRLS